MGKFAENRSSVVRATVAAVCVMAVASSCGRDPGRVTFEYLGKVALVRDEIEKEDRETIPKMIRNRDYAELEKEVIRIKAYGEALSNIPKEGVDLEAVMYADNLKSYLDPLGKICSDIVGLLKGIDKARQMDLPNYVAVPDISAALSSANSNTFDLVDAIMTAIGPRNAWHLGAYDPLQPYQVQIGIDSFAVSGLKQIIGVRAGKVQDDLQQRYPKFNWTPRGFL
jgi:hypothetical protein